jgi:hypothetical protein
VICSLEDCPTPSTCTKTCNSSGSCT